MSKYYICQILEILEVWAPKTKNRQLDQIILCNQCFNYHLYKTNLQTINLVNKKLALGQTYGQTSWFQSDKTEECVYKRWMLLLLSKVNKDITQEWKKW